MASLLDRASPRSSFFRVSYSGTVLVPQRRGWLWFNRHETQVRRQVRISCTVFCEWVETKWRLVCLQCCQPVASVHSRVKTWREETIVELIPTVAPVL
jgi:hypothetical protein